MKLQNLIIIGVAVVVILYFVTKKTSTNKVDTNADTYDSSNELTAISNDSSLSYAEKLQAQADVQYKAELRLEYQSLYGALPPTNYSIAQLEKSIEQRKQFNAAVQAYKQETGDLDITDNQFYQTGKIEDVNTDLDVWRANMTKKRDVWKARQQYLMSIARDISNNMIARKNGVEINLMKTFRDSISELEKVYMYYEAKKLQGIDLQYDLGVLANKSNKNWGDADQALRMLNNALSVASSFGRNSDSINEYGEWK